MTTENTPHETPHDPAPVGGIRRDKGGRPRTDKGGRPLTVDAANKRAATKRAEQAEQ